MAPLSFVPELEPRGPYEYFLRTIFESDLNMVARIKRRRALYLSLDHPKDHVMA